MTWKWLHWTKYPHRRTLTNPPAALNRCYGTTTMTTPTMGMLGSSPFFVKKRRHVGEKKCPKMLRPFGGRPLELSSRWAPVFIDLLFPDPRTLDATNAPFHHNR